MGVKRETVGALPVCTEYPRRVRDQQNPVQPHSPWCEWSCAGPPLDSVRAGSGHWVWSCDKAGLCPSARGLGRSQAQKDTGSPRRTGHEQKCDRKHNDPTYLVKGGPWKTESESPPLWAGVQALTLAPKVQSFQSSEGTERAGVEARSREPRKVSILAAGVEGWPKLQARRFRLPSGVGKVLDSDGQGRPGRLMLSGTRPLAAHPPSGEAKPFARCLWGPGPWQKAPGAPEARGRHTQRPGA